VLSDNVGALGTRVTGRGTQISAVPL